MAATWYVMVVVTIFGILPKQIKIFWLDDIWDKK